MSEQEPIPAADAAETPAAEVAAPVVEAAPAAPPPVVETAPEAKPAAKPEAKPEAKPDSRPQGGRPAGESRGPRPNQESRGGRPAGGPGGDRGPRSDDRRGGDRGDRGPRGDDRRGADRGGTNRPDLMDIDLEKLMADSLYLDNQAHAVVVRMRDMESGTRSQLRRLYSAVRRACRAPESERQHHFVMLRARLAYTIARHSLRSLDGLERLLLQVTRKNDARGYERFRDLFEAIVAYNE